MSSTLGVFMCLCGLLWGIWEVFVTLGVDKLRSLVYAVKHHKVYEGLIEHKELGNGGL